MEGWARPKLQTVVHGTTGIKVWLRQSALAYLVLVNIEYQPEPLPHTLADQWLLASSTTSRSGSTISWGINMQGNIAGATPTSRGSYNM